MSLTDVAAWVGAVTGVGVLLWDIYKWKTSGPRVKITLTPGMARAIPGQSETPDRYLWVKVVNTGSASTTLTTLGFFFYRSKSDIKRKQHSWASVVKQPGMEQPLPHVLNPGHQWDGLVRQDDELIDRSREGYLICCAYHALAEDPITKRLVITEPDPSRLNNSPRLSDLLRDLKFFL